MKTDLPSLHTYAGQSSTYTIACPPRNASSKENLERRDQLWPALEAIFDKCEQEHHTEFVPTTIARCAQGLRSSRESLMRAKMVSSADRELLAADLRLALNQFGRKLSELFTPTTFLTKFSVGFASGNS